MQSPGPCDSNIAMRYGLLLALVTTGIITSLSSAAEQDASQKAAAIHAALAKNIGHTREWLEQSDYKSVAQSAGGLQLLTDLLKAKSDDAAWQAAVSNVVSAAGEVQSAARSEDPAKCKAALAVLEKAASAAAALKPTGQPQSPPKAPALRSLMLAMDAIQADAKVALITGDVAAAKKQASVLAELAGLVSNSRNTEQWSSLAGDFASAAAATATSTETDPKTLRQVFRGVAQRCDGCHEKNRTR